MANENLKNILNSVEEDMDLLLDPVKLTKHDMGELFTEFVGYDPTTYWDHEIMMDQMIKLTETDGEILSVRPLTTERPSCDCPTALRAERR